ncbi:MAG: hypothetical protein L7T87_04195, partial [Schleiferiaceae bacterium]|nr:hypothetical protein [Schleiferiaceae bacterium]
GSGFQFIWHGVTSTAALSYLLMLIYQLFFSTEDYRKEVKFISVVRGFDWILTYPTFFLVFLYLFNYKYQGLASTTEADENYVYIYFWVVFITMLCSMLDDVFVTTEQDKANTDSSLVDKATGKNLAGARRWVRLLAAVNYLFYMGFTVWFFFPVWWHGPPLYDQICSQRPDVNACKRSAMWAGAIFFLIPMVPYFLGKLCVWSHNFDYSHAFYCFGDVWVKVGIFVWILLESKDLFITNCPLGFLYTDGSNDVSTVCTP